MFLTLLPYIAGYLGFGIIVAEIISGVTKKKLTPMPKGAYLLLVLGWPIAILLVIFYSIQLALGYDV